MAMDEKATASWRREYGSVYRYIRRRTASREDAEDVTQEVFVAAIRALGEARLEAEGPHLAWLYTVARRRLTDRLRRGSEASGLFDPESAVSNPDGRSYGPAIVQALLEGLRSMNEAQRRIVVLKVFEGRSFAEIAAEVGATEEACRMRLSRGLSALRQHLEKKGVTP
jgi:RNA polymerase sigma-70 factor (ECF subfamily)